MCDHMFVVTGGPGTGKSILIDQLTRRGVARMPEAGRAIIKDQVRIGGAALPWEDRALFAELMLSWDLRSYQEALSSEVPVLMDRGIPDTIAYLRLCGAPVPAHFQAAAKLHRYNRLVFLAPFWEEIYAQDDERKQSVEEARATGSMLAQTYAELGYELVELPFASVEERANFLLARLDEAGVISR